MCFRLSRSLLLLSFFVTSCSSSVATIPKEELFAEAQKNWPENVNTADASWSVRSVSPNTNIAIDGQGIVQHTSGAILLNLPALNVQGILSNEQVNLVAAIKIRSVTDALFVSIESLQAKVPLPFLEDIPLKIWVSVPITKDQNRSKAFITNPYDLLSNIALETVNRSYILKGAPTGPMLLSGSTSMLTTTIMPKSFKTTTVTLQESVSEAAYNIDIELELKNQRTEDKPIFNFTGN